MILKKNRRYILKLLGLTCSSLFISNHSVNSAFFFNRYKDDKVKGIPDDWFKLDQTVHQYGNYILGLKLKNITFKNCTLNEIDFVQTDLSDAIFDNNKDEIVDALGDILVTIIIQAELQGVSLTECLESAYNVIAKRTGKMVNGQFQKDA